VARASALLNLETSPVPGLPNTCTGGEVEEVAAPSSANLTLQEEEAVEAGVEVDKNTGVEDDLLLLLASYLAVLALDSPETDRSPPSADAFFAGAALCSIVAVSQSFANAESSSVAFFGILTGLRRTMIKCAGKGDGTRISA
jgi:hypothetical protein